MPPRDPDLTLVVPCFEERARVDRLVDAARAWVAAHPALDVELLVVDDGSTDGTAARVEELSRAWPGLRLVRLRGNQGKGAALKAGVLAARGRVLVLLDADLAVSLDHVDAVLPSLLDGVDVTIGSRALEGARIVRPQGRVRRWMGRWYLRVARRVLGLTVSDVTCGFKGFRRDAARRLFEPARSSRWGIDAEVLDRARRLGLVVREVPVAWEDGGESRVKPVRDAVRSLVELVAVRWRRRREG